MMWPLNILFKPAQAKIRAAEIAAAEARTKRYEKLFALDDMVRRSLILLEPKRDEPPA